MRRGQAVRVRGRGHPRSVDRALLCAAIGCAACAAYLLTLLGAAALAQRRQRPEDECGGGPWRWLVLIPAHDEEPVIGSTLASVAALDGEPAARDVVVIADHCTDRTAAIAEAHGATVLPRTGGPRSKGAALDWALGQLCGRLEACDGVLVLDADSIPSPELLLVMERRMRAGARVVQANYEVANPAAAAASGLRDAGFRLMNTVRPQGRDALGLSAGLRGTGMAFHPSVLRRHGWATASLLEDFEQHAILVLAGERVRFAADARVRSPMPTSLRAGRSQLTRWASGRPVILRRWGGPLLLAALRRRDVARLEALLDLVVPPQAVLLAANLATVLAAVAARSRRPVGVAAGSLAGQVVFVLGGLWTTRAPRATYRALLSTPALVVHRLAIAARMIAGQRPDEFVRTPREPSQR